MKKQIPEHFIRIINKKITTQNSRRGSLSCCVVGGSFIFYCSSIVFRIAFTVKRCVSAQKPWLAATWVSVGGYGLLVGEWVVTGCVVPLLLGSLSLLRVARQRTNLKVHHQRFLVKRCASPNEPGMAGEHPWSKWMRTIPPNMYFVVKPCASPKKTWITVDRCVRRGGKRV